MRKTLLFFLFVLCVLCVQASFVRGANSATQHASFAEEIKTIPELYTKTQRIGESSVTEDPTAPRETVPLPPPPSGYMADCFTADGRYIAVGGASTDVVYDKPAAWRFAPMLKVSLLSGLCGSAPSGKYNPLIAFCNGKTYHDCKTRLEDLRGVKYMPGDPRPHEVCDPYAMWKADQAILFAESSDAIPDTATEPVIYCACEPAFKPGLNGQVITGGVCTNHLNCFFLEPAAAASTATPTL